MRAPGTGYAMKTAIIAVLFLLALPVAASAQTAPGGPGADGALDRGGQGRLRHVRGDREQGLAHARRRPPDRGLLSRPRHAQRARARLHRLRRQDIRPADSDAANRSVRAARLAQPDLPAGERAARPLPRDEDLRDRPGPQRAPGGRPLRVAHGQEARPLRATTTRASATTAWTTAAVRAATPCSRATPAAPCRARLSARRASSGHRADISGRRATAGRTCATSAWTPRTRPRRTGTSFRRRSTPLTGVDGRPAAHGRARLRRHDGGCADRRADLAVRRLRHGAQRIRGGLARLPERAEGRSRRAPPGRARSTTSR